jgi:hypothetical protein
MTAPSIIYLDADDEITAAAARIRATATARIAIVVPPGSKVATSRINFLLLAREAQSRSRHLSVIAPDGPSRAIAASAGLDTYPSVAAFETAAGTAGAVAPPSVAAASAAATATAAAAVAADAERPPSAAQPSQPPAPQPPVPPQPAAPPPARPEAPRARGGAIVAPRPQRSRRGLLIAAIVLVGVLVVAVVGAAIYLPSATITVTPRPEPVGPIEVTVSADPAATEVDPAGKVVPATTVDFPVSASQTFEASGRRVEEENASGTVTFDSINTVGPVVVPRGTRVSTLGGVVFATTKAVNVPKAVVAGSTIKHGRVNVGVRATKAGPDGNVEAGEITQVPDFLSTQQVSVSNGKATSGGKRQEFPRVTSKDVAAASKALETELERSFADAVATEAGVPTGLTLFPQTAVLGPIAYDPEADDLVGDEVETFTMTATAIGTATAVDVEQVGLLVEDALRASVAAGARLVPGSVDIAIGQPSVTGSVVTFPVSAQADQVRPVDAAAVEQAALGLPLDQAQRVLGRYGTVSIEVWPEFVGSIPTFDPRVDVIIVDVTPPSGAASQPP